MSKNIILEIPESEAAKFEAMLDQLLDELKRLEEHEAARTEEFSLHSNGLASQ